MPARPIIYYGNPVLHRRCADVTVSEGCLSVPGPRADLPRAALALVTGFDQHGNPITISGTGYFARCLQHEYDHLNGTLYVDRLPAGQRGELLSEAGLR
ncbi:peptide deformylase [Actinoplanes derwentensis]|uniref:peptide deformylase n=1 Tax=Actinoplanes derwentensis TaxID=113562 RepID=UPI000AA5F094|nr:hypothetical protein Ade03nite_25860 [Actinoplanes derwentensis]